jgi:hypothetical protein
LQCFSERAGLPFAGAVIPNPADHGPDRQHHSAGDPAQGRAVHEDDDAYRKDGPRKETKVQSPEPYVSLKIEKPQISLTKDMEYSSRQFT